MDNEMEDAEEQDVGPDGMESPDQNSQQEPSIDQNDQFDDDLRNTNMDY